MSTVSPAGSPPTDPTLPYHPPRLEFFGHVASLTRGSLSSMEDKDGSKTLAAAMTKLAGPDFGGNAFDDGSEPWLQP